jgi:uncharacterized protein YfiM (DUF2279 family)
MRLDVLGIGAICTHRANGKPEPTSRWAGRLSVLLVLLFGPSAAAQSSDPWLGQDKALHFSVSIGLGAAGYTGASLCTDDRDVRLGVGILGAFTVGAGKELWDATGAGQAS